MRSVASAGPLSRPNGVLDLDDLRADRGVMDVVDADDYVIGEAPRSDRRRDGQRAMLSWRDLR
jgi:hypothetical protein